MGVDNGPPGASDYLTFKMHHSRSLSLGRLLPV